MRVRVRVGHVRTDEQFRNFRRSPVIGDIVHYNSRTFKYSIFRGKTPDLTNRVMV